MPYYMRENIGNVITENGLIFKAHKILIKLQSKKLKKKTLKLSKYGKRRLTDISSETISGWSVST